eukprot:4350417-Prymnesium_polylepis.1
MCARDKCVFGALVPLASERVARRPLVARPSSGWFGAPLSLALRGRLSPLSGWLGALLCHAPQAGGPARARQVDTPAKKPHDSESMLNTLLQVAFEPFEPT